jgi:hypothetical protein
MTDIIIELTKENLEHLLDKGKIEIGQINKQKILLVKKQYRRY